MHILNGYYNSKSLFDIICRDQKKYDFYKPTQYKLLLRQIRIHFQFTVSINSTLMEKRGKAIDSAFIHDAQFSALSFLAHVIFQFSLTGDSHSLITALQWL